MPVHTAKQWVMLYGSGGEEAVMGSRGNRRYDWETKVAAARDHVENGPTKTEVMAEHGIASIATLGRWCREYRAGGADASRPKPEGRPKGSRSRPRPGPAREQELAEEIAYLGGEGRVPGKTAGPAGEQVTRRERSAVVRLLAGRGHRPGHLLRIAGLAGSAYFHRLSRPGHVTRAGLEPLAGEIWARTANGCGHRQIRMCLVHGFGRRVSAKTVLRVMRRMGLKCPIRAASPWRRYGSYGGDTGGKVPNPLKRDFGADGPFARLGADVAEFKVAGSKAYLAPVYDMASKEIVAWDVSRHPGMNQRKRPLAMPGDKLPDGANPIPHSDMGWRYQRPWWRKELERLNIRRSMSRKGNRLDNACISSSRCFVFSHVFFSGWGWCRFVGLVIDSITTNHATRPSPRRRSMMPVPNSVLILLSRYQTMYSSSMPMNSSMVTPAKLRLWKNSCLRRPKNPSAAALSGLHPFALIERVRPCSVQMRIHSGHR